MQNKWTPEQKRLLFSDLSNEEIAKITGRDKRAVEVTRYRYTGHYCTKETQRKNQDERRKGIRGEVRIVDACKRLKIKIADCKG